jgi:uncharacterized protein (TIGR03437 family)
MKVMTRQVLLVALLMAQLPMALASVAQERDQAVEHQPCVTGAGLQGLRLLTVNAFVRNVASGDFNRDGKLDLAVSEITGTLPFSKISLWFGDGQGGFEIITRFETLGVFTDLDAGDLNGDGRLDLVGSGNAVFGPDAGAVAMLGNGEGTFTTANTITVGAGNATSLVADFNGDGRDDAAIANLSFTRLAIALSGVDGKLGTPATIPLPDASSALAVGDLNGDGKQDLVVVNFNRLTVLINDGAGRFNAVPGPETMGNGIAIVTGEFNGDGKADVAVAFSTSVITFWGDGLGGLGDRKSFGGKGGTSIAARDFSGDGKDDLVLGNSGVTLLVNDGAGNFDTAFNASTDAPPTTLVAADLNGDGKADVATASQNSTGISLLFNSGDGRLQGPPVVNFSQLPVTATIGDLNKDGKPDLIVTDVQSMVVVSFGDGRGGFGPPRRIESVFFINDGLTAAVVADFDKDGNSDLAVGGQGSVPNTGNVVVVAYGDGNGNFSETRTRRLPVGMRPAELIAGDFNNDGRTDLATANAGSNDVSLLLGDALGGFGAARTIPAGLEPRSLAAADFNGDGKLDLAVANRNSVTLSVLIGDGQGGFHSMLIGVGANPRLVKTVDFNGDGKIDLFVPQNNAGLVSVLLGNGAGEFGAPLNTSLGGLPLSVAVGDFTGDGRQDFALIKLIRDDVAENRIQIFAGDGAGRFAAAGDLSLILARQVTAADLNSDGLSDLVGIKINSISGGGDAWSFLGRCNPPPSATLASVSAASFRRQFLAGESIVAAFGVGLSAETAVANTLPLPTQLAGTSVKVKDSAGVERLAPLFFVSPNQINYQMPPGTAAGAATVTVSSANGSTVIGTTQIAEVAPGLFTANANGQGAPAGVVLRLQPDGRPLYEPLARFDSAANQFVPASISLSVLGPTLDRVFLIFFGTGLRGASAGAKVELAIGDRKVDVLYAGPQGDFVGVDQVNAELMRGFFTAGEYDVTLTINGRVTNTVRIRIN